MLLEDRLILVTGGAGFIGSHVVDVLVGRGARVIVFDDMSSGSEENLGSALSSGRVEIRCGDVRSQVALRSAIRRVDVVFHMAVSNLRESLGDPFHSHSVNAEGTLQVLEAASQANVKRFIYCSSSEIYGTAVRVPMAESHPAQPTTVYGASKLAGEVYTRAYCKTYGLASAIVRPFNSYGPREHMTGMAGEVIPRMVLRAMAGRAPLIFGAGTQSRDFTYVTETAEGIVRAGECDALVGNAVNIARGEEVAIRRIAEIVSDMFGSPEPIARGARPGDVDRHLADVSAAQQLLDFRASISIEAGIKKYVECLRALNLDAEALLLHDADDNWTDARALVDRSGIESPR